MKQWQREKENPDLEAERIKAQEAELKKVQTSKKVGVGAMLSWHNIVASTLPAKPDLDNVPEADYYKGK